MSEEKRKKIIFLIADLMRKADKTNYYSDEPYTYTVEACDIVGGIIDLAVQKATEQTQSSILERVAGCVKFDAVEDVERLRLENERLKAENKQLRAQGWRWVARDGLPEVGGRYIVARNIPRIGRTIGFDYWSETRQSLDGGSEKAYAWKPCDEPPPLETPEVTK